MSMSTTHTAVSLLSMSGGTALVAQATFQEVSSIWETLGILGAILVLAGFFGWLLSGHLAAQNIATQEVAKAVTDSNDRANENHTKSIEVLTGLLHATQELGTRVASLEHGHAAIKESLLEIKSMHLGGRK